MSKLIHTGSDDGSDQHERGSEVSGAVGLKKVKAAPQGAASKRLL